MEKVYITNDGKSHKSVNDALNYVRSEYGKILTKISHSVAGEHYVDITTILHASLDDMRLLLDLEREFNQIADWDDSNEDTEEAF